MVADAPPISQVLPEFLAFCGGRVLCAHNADFDVGFLTAAAERLGLPFDPTYLDTLIFAQNLMPQLTNHKLDTVGAFLGLKFQHHDALEDARVCAAIPVYARRALGTVDDFPALVRALGVRLIPFGQARMGYGAGRGGWRR